MCSVVKSVQFSAIHVSLDHAAYSDGRKGHFCVRSINHTLRIFGSISLIAMAIAWDHENDQLRHPELGVFDSMDILSPVYKIPIAEFSTNTRSFSFLTFMGPSAPRSSYSERLNAIRATSSCVPEIVLAILSINTC